MPKAPSAASPRRSSAAVSASPPRPKTPTNALAKPAGKAAPPTLSFADYAMGKIFNPWGAIVQSPIKPFEARRMLRAQLLARHAALAQECAQAAQDATNADLAASPAFAVRPMAAPIAPILARAFAQMGAGAQPVDDIALADVMDAALAIVPLAGDAGRWRIDIASARDGQARRVWISDRNGGWDQLWQWAVTAALLGAEQHVAVSIAAAPLPASIAQQLVADPAQTGAQRASLLLQWAVSAVTDDGANPPDCTPARGRSGAEKNSRIGAICHYHALL